MVDPRIDGLRQLLIEDNILITSVIIDRSSAYYFNQHTQSPAPLSITIEMEIDSIDDFNERITSIVELVRRGKIDDLACEDPDIKELYDIYVASRILKLGL